MRSRILTAISTLLLVSAQPSLCAPESAAKTSEAKSAATVVHLSHFGDNLHATVMALKICRALQKRKVPVTLFLDQEGVRLADKRQPQDLRWGESEKVSTYFNAFVESGGKVLVCPHCAPAAGLEETNVREGGRIATEDEIGSAIADAQKIMDY